MTQLGFFFDANACIGCKACMVACKDVHNLPVGYKMRKVVTGEAGGWRIDAASGLPQPVDVFSYSVSYSCMHCDDPACLPKCPRQAISKGAETGVVSIDQELCIGCGACAKACPWSAPVVVPRIDGKRKTWKCDLCSDLQTAGEEPACVAACSMRCLKVMDMETYAPAEAVRLTDAHEPLLADAPDLGPNMVMVPHRERVKHPDVDVRMHSMPEEYVNG